MAIGWFVDDAADWVGDRLSDAWDVVDGIPGFRELGEGTKAVFKGPLRDFAKTGLGQTVLRAMTTVAMGPIGWVAGPWAMMIAASLPGVARGDSFEEALFSENLWRLSKTAEILGSDYAGELVAQYGAALEELKRRAREVAPDLDVPAALQELATRAGVDPESYARKLAAALGIREDMAAQAFEMLARVRFFRPENYDEATGKDRGAIRLPLTDRTTVRNAQIDRVLDTLDPGRDFRLAARAAVPSMLNPSPALAIFREARAAAPAPAPDRARSPEVAAVTGSPLPFLALGVAVVGAAIWYARR